MGQAKGPAPSGARRSAADVTRSVTSNRVSTVSGDCHFSSLGVLIMPLLGAGRGGSRTDPGSVVGGGKGIGRTRGPRRAGAEVTRADRAFAVLGFVNPLLGGGVKRRGQSRICSFDIGDRSATVVDCRPVDRKVAPSVAAQSPMRKSGSTLVGVGLVRRHAVHVTHRADWFTDRCFYPFTWSFPGRPFLPGQHGECLAALRAPSLQLLLSAHRAFVRCNSDLSNVNGAKLGGPKRSPTYEATQWPQLGRLSIFPGPTLAFQLDGCG